MADYVNLNYTAAEINADLAKVHGVDAVVPEAPKDGTDYVRRDGEWIKDNDDELLNIAWNISKNKECSKSDFNTLMDALTENSKKVLNNKYYQNVFYCELRKVNTSVYVKLSCQSNAEINTYLIQLILDTTTDIVTVKSKDGGTNFAPKSLYNSYVFEAVTNIFNEKCTQEYYNTITSACESSLGIGCCMVFNGITAVPVLINNTNDDVLALSTCYCTQNVIYLESITISRADLTISSHKKEQMSFINTGTGTKYLSDNGQYQELYSKSEIDSKIGDINTILDSINGEEV